MVHATNVVTLPKGWIFMKKIVPLALSALLFGTVAVSAAQPTNIEGSEQTVQQAAFVQHSGKITAVEQRENAKLFTVGEQDNGFHFYVDDKTLVFDQAGNEVALQVGDQISLSIYANQPMILIYPPQYAPPVVIVEKQGVEGSVKVAQFDENFLSDDGALKLNLQKDSIIVNAKGEKIAANDLKNYSAIVFYGPMTKSIPPQTSPEKIVVFPKLEDSYEEELPQPAPTPTIDLDAIIGNDVKTVNGKKMIPLRKVAEQLGYQVDAKGKSIVVSKGSVSYNLTRGEKAYGNDRASFLFDVAPTLLEKNKTYVQYEFAEQLLQ